MIVRSTEDWWRRKAAEFFDVSEAEVEGRGVEIYKGSMAGHAAELSFQLSELMTAARPRWIPKRWWPWPKTEDGSSAT